MKFQQDGKPHRAKTVRAIVREALMVLRVVRSDPDVKMVGQPWRSEKLSSVFANASRRDQLVRERLFHEGEDDDCFHDSTGNVGEDTSDALASRRDPDGFDVVDSMQEADDNVHGTKSISLLLETHSALDGLITFVPC